ncbi:MAG: hypothetical protein HY926_12455 [Elusimicrobia bacterium]|nr:hypothetical protein [Elusimicrobiota bacterium]
MKVDVERRGRSFRYRLRLDSDDHEESRRDFKDAPAPFLLVNHEYRMDLPRCFRDIHPDVHSLAVWYTLRPLVASRLELPFAASPEFARWLSRKHGVRLTNVDESQSPRRRPETVAPALLFSGGMDSMAASLLMPRGTHHIVLDRIPHQRPGDNPDILVDLAVTRAACAAVAAGGAPVHATADDHEFLFSPYPMWHSDMGRLPALYLADSLGLSTLDAGEVFDATYFGGYHAGASRWRMRPPEDPAGPRAPARRSHNDPDGFWNSVGLRRADSICGLSEVVTTKVVARSRYRGKSFSCYYPPRPRGEAFCMRCDKCFKKLLLRHITDGREVPASLFEHFLSQPHLAAVFARPYFDWHHVWYYAFQQMRCRHWFARELQKQARQGPDLSLLEKWYPKARLVMEPAYTEEVQRNISRYAETMSPAEMARLEHLDIPPLHAPPLKDRPAAARNRGPAGARPEPFSAQTKALFRLLQSKLLGGRPPHWGGYRLEEVFLRPPEASIWFRLSPAGRRAAAGELVLLLSATAPDGPRPLVRLGSLGIFSPLESRADASVLRPMARSLVAVFREARQDITRA